MCHWASTQSENKVIYQKYQAIINERWNGFISLVNYHPDEFAAYNSARNLVGPREWTSRNLISVYVFHV